MKTLVDKYMGSSVLFRSPDDNNGGQQQQAPADNQFGFGTGDITFDGGGTGYGADDSAEDQADIAELFGAFGVDESFVPDDTKPPSQQGGFTDVPPERVTELETEIRNTIAGIRVPDAAIPEGFDPNDRGQLMAVLNQTAQAAVAQSMQVVFKPVQVAMQQMASQIEARIQQGVETGLNSHGAKNLLRDLVPESVDPQYSGMVANMDKMLRDKGKKPEERAKLIRKMFNQMGINGKANAPATQQAAPNTPAAPTAVRSGKSALDSFFGGLGGK